MMKRIFYLGLMVGMMHAMSCIDEISIPVNATKDNVNISAVISDTLEVQKVSIAKTITVGKDAPVDGAPVSSAKVFVTSTQGEKFIFLESKTKGIYESTFQIVPGRPYRLEIELQYGRKYLSTYKSAEKISLPFSVFTKLNSKTILSSNNTITTVSQVGAYINSNLQSNGKPLKAIYRVTGEYVVTEFYLMILNPRTCYARENLDYNNLAAFDGADYPGGKLQEVNLINTLADFRFFDTYCFHVDQYIVDDDTYTYFNQLNKLLNKDNSLFAVPPGRIKGNITNPDNPSEDISGYFFIGSKSGIKHFTNANKLGAHVNAMCMDPLRTIRRFSDFPACYDCLLLPNSQRTKPPYWP